MPFPSRRTFLQTAVAAVASFFLPRGLRAEGRASVWFLHTETGDSWPVADPVAWALANSTIFRPTAPSIRPPAIASTAPPG